MIVEDKAIADLDFELIKRKLTHGKSGLGWSRERAEAVEHEYRRFLYLMKRFPNELTAPSVEVDTFWHQHILDTAKYAHDCMAVFGYFLHHYPYLGLKDEADNARRLRAGARMRELYEASFGAPSASDSGRTAFCAKIQAMPAEPDRPILASDNAAPAFCAVAQGPSTGFCAASTLESETGLCAVTQEAATAFCAVAQEAAPAFCAVAIDASARDDTAFCAVADEELSAAIMLAATPAQTPRPRLG
jgi:hypothetical protein